MKIAFIHSFYKDGAASGENVAVENQLTALSDSGETIGLFSKESTVDKDNSISMLRLGLSVSLGLGTNPNEWLNEFRPDVVHVHNTFPHIGTNWMSDCKFPIVATVHNYRTVCAAGTLLRDGAECFECPKNGSWSAVLHACYRGSRAASLPLAIANRRGVMNSYLALENVTPIFLSERQKHQFQDLGFDPKVSHVVPNFVSAPEVPLRSFRDRDDFIFVGRLAQEKGIVELVEAWSDEIKLVVVGDGPLRETIARKIGTCKKNIVLKGRLPRDKVLELLQGAKALVFPSLWSEGLPTIVLEAFSLGLPVLTTRGNSAADLISAKGGGWVLDSVEALVRSCEFLDPFWGQLSTDAHLIYRNEFTAKVWLNRMKKIYLGVTEA